MSLPELIVKTKINAHRHGWYITEENLPTYLLLVVSEISEAVESWRNKEPIGEELADIVIRILHISADLGIDLTDEINKKMVINENRPYHHGRKRL